MCAVSTLTSESQRRMAAETNSGPLSERRYLGAPWTVMSFARTSMTRPERDAAGDVDGERLAGPLVDDGEALQLLTGSAGVEDEVVGPDVVARRGRQGAGPARGNAAPRPPAWNLEAGCPPAPVGAVDAHPEPLPAEEDPDAAVAVAWVHRRELAHPLEHGRVGLGLPRFVAER
jgi:hypothetical protein